jgi:TrpR-related protein YerC/YecD
MPQARKSQNAKFQQKEKYSPNKLERNFMKALSQLENEKQATALVRDLMTTQEIQEFANRLETARLLYKGDSYQEVSKKTGVSTTTVTRVAHWLYNGCGGYWKYLKDNF